MSGQPLENLQIDIRGLFCYVRWELDIVHERYVLEIFRVKVVATDKNLDLPVVSVKHLAFSLVTAQVVRPGKLVYDFYLVHGYVKLILHGLLWISGYRDISLLDIWISGYQVFHLMS